MVKQHRNINGDVNNDDDYQERGKLKGNKNVLCCWTILITTMLIIMSTVEKLSIIAQLLNHFIQLIYDSPSNKY